jgi:hypothetical protein
MVVHVRVKTGHTYRFNDDGSATYIVQWSEKEEIFPIQTVVREVRVVSEERAHTSRVEDLFPNGTRCVVMDTTNYGLLGEVCALF